MSNGKFSIMTDAAENICEVNYSRDMDLLGKMTDTKLIVHEKRFEVNEAFNQELEFRWADREMKNLIKAIVTEKDVDVTCLFERLDNLKEYVKQLEKFVGERDYTQEIINIAIEAFEFGTTSNMEPEILASEAMVLQEDFQVLKSMQVEFDAILDPDTKKMFEKATQSIVVSMEKFGVTPRFVKNKRNEPIVEIEFAMKLATAEKYNINFPFRNDQILNS